MIYKSNLIGLPIRKSLILLICAVVGGVLGFLFSVKILSNNRIERVTVSINKNIELHQDIIYINSWDIKWFNKSTVMMAGELLRETTDEVLNNVDDLKKIKVDIGDKGLLNIRGYYDPYKRQYNIFLTKSSSSFEGTTSDVLARIEGRIIARFLDKVRPEIDRKLAQLRGQAMHLSRIERFGENSNHKFVEGHQKQISLSEINGEIEDLSSYKLALSGLNIFKNENAVISEGGDLKKSLLFAILCAFASAVISVFLFGYSSLREILSIKKKTYET